MPEASPDIYKGITYASNPFPQSEPARLYGLARLFGLGVPGVETMRVLELGCSTAGNIIPLAVRFPRARFLGVDLAPRHVAEARERIGALGLRNIEVVEGDIATFDPAGQTFDAIISHGVYSWIPPAAREGLLRIAGRHLAPEGVAYISYNVFPGWHLRSIIRDLMLYHAGPENLAPAAERIAKARWVIENVSKIANAGSPYGAKLQEEAKALAGWGDHYIYGEFLVAYNDPCYFRDFIAAADRAGLAFLCEAEIESCLPETHGEEVARLIRTMSANQLVPMEQYIDFFMGRQFRQTLLVRRDREATIRRQLEPARAAGLHVHGRLAFLPAESGASKFVYRTPQGRTITTISPVVRRALDVFAAAFPETRTADELVSQLRSGGVSVTPDDEAAILDTVFKMIVAGLVKVSTEPVRLGRADDPRPIAFALARVDAAARRPGTTNLRHETQAIDVVMQVLLPLLDGRADTSRLERALVAATEAGQLNINDDQTGMPLKGAALGRAVSDHVRLAVRRLADAGLLLPSAGDRK